MKALSCSLLCAVLFSMPLQAKAATWECEGFGYAYSYKTKLFIYSRIQTFTIEKGGVPTDISFRNDWKSYLRGEVGNLTKDDFQVDVNQYCKRSVTPRGARDKLNKLKSRYTDKGFSRYFLKYYSY